jgi:hypothetical protein
LLSTRAVNAGFTTLLRFLADLSILKNVQACLGYQAFEVVEMRARGGVVVVLRDARGKLYDNSVFSDLLLFADAADQVCELAMDGPAATAAAGYVDLAIDSVGGVV